MKNNNINWVLLLGVVLVVAIVAGLIGAFVSNEITGNVIKLNADKGGKNQVYTKAETDKRISDAITILLDNIITDEIFEPLQELRLIEHCNQYVQLETKRQINLGGESYDLELISVESSNNATIKIGNVIQSVTKGQTYNLGAVSGGGLIGMNREELKVYVKGIQYVPTTDNAKIVMLEVTNCKI